MTVPHRCTIRRRCGKMVTLKRHIDQYIRRPKCPGCGQDTLQPYYCMRLRDLRVTCKCGGVHFPHKRGLILSKNEFCKHAVFDSEFGAIKVREMKENDACPF